MFFLSNHCFCMFLWWNQGEPLTVFAQGLWRSLASQLENHRLRGERSASQWRKRNKDGKICMCIYIIIYIYIYLFICLCASLYCKCFWLSICGALWLLLVCFFIYLFTSLVVLPFAYATMHPLISHLSLANFPHMWPTSIDPRLDLGFYGCISYCANTHACCCASIPLRSMPATLAPREPWVHMLHLQC